jgi:hypothetical protein
MKSFNDTLDKLLVTRDYDTSNPEVYDYYEEQSICHLLISLKRHIRILKTLNQNESSRIETDTLYEMYTSLSEPDPIKGMTGNNHKYTFLALVTDFICYSKFNCKYHGDKPEEIPMVLDNLIDYIDDLFSKSKQRIFDNCIDEKDKVSKKRILDILSEESIIIDDRAI